MSTPGLYAHGVTKRYRRRVALRGADLSVRSGESVAVVGENGSGKTTLLRVCAGLLAPDAGTVARHGRVGYCPQQPTLVDMLTAGEHLVLFGRAAGLGRAAALEQGWRILDAFGFRSDDAALVRDLSGGTRQKLNLALALLGEPDVLLLDEPYQGFDHGTYVDFWDLVERWRRQRRAVVIVTHMLAELRRVDRVVELTAGAPVPQATP